MKRLMLAITLIAIIGGEFVFPTAPLYADEPVAESVIIDGEVATPITTIPARAVEAENEDMSVYSTGRRWETADGDELWEYVAEIKATSTQDTSWHAESAMTYTTSQDGLTAMATGTTVVVTTDFGNLIWTPTVSIGGISYNTVSDPTVIDDIIDSHYKGNVIQWDYGICKRYLRITDGLLSEQFMFATNPSGDIVIDIGVDPSSTLGVGEVYAQDANGLPIAIQTDGDVKTITQDALAISTFPIIIDPTTAIESYSFDGYMYYYNQSAFGGAGSENFQYMWDYSTANIMSTSATTMLTGFDYNVYPYYGYNYSRTNIYRSYLYFNTSPLYGALISDAYVRLYATALYNDNSSYHPSLGRAILTRGIYNDSDAFAMPPQYPGPPYWTGWGWQNKLTATDFNQSKYTGGLDPLIWTQEISAICTPWAKGDLNGDGYVDYIDLYGIANVYLGNVRTNASVNYSADCNGDGYINGSDLVACDSIMRGYTGLPTVAYRAIQNVGDANGDGIITYADFTMIMSVSVGSYIPTVEEFWRCDANADRFTIDVGDLVVIGQNWFPYKLYVGRSSANVSTGWNTLDLNAEGIRCINTSSPSQSWTYYCLRIEREMRALADWNGSDRAHYFGGSQYVSWATQESGVTTRPRLVVTYIAYAPPVVRTDSASRVGIASARLNGYLQSDGGHRCKIGFIFQKNGSTYWNVSSGYYGDIDLDDWVTEEDYNLLCGYLNSSEYLSPAQLLRADMNHDSTITSNDSASILSVISGNMSQDVYMQNNVSTGALFYKDISGLDSGQLYKFNTFAMHEVFQVNGSLKTFTTLLTMGDPSGLTATPYAGSMLLTWIPANGAETTIIRCKANSYPADTDDGTLVCNSDDTSFTQIGLLAGTTYYYRAWGYAGGIYSSNYSQTFASTPAVAGAVANPEQGIQAPNTSSWFSSPSSARLSKLPGYQLVNEMADAMGMPHDTWWFLLSMGFITVMGLFIYVRYQNLLAGFTVATVLGVLCSNLGMIPLWTMFIFSVTTLGFSWRELR